MATVGKKKKKVYYVKKKGGNMPLLLIGAAAVAAFIFMNKSSTTTPVADTNDPAGTGTGVTDATGDNTPATYYGTTPSGVAYTVTRVGTQFTFTSLDGKQRVVINVPAGTAPPPGWGTTSFDPFGYAAPPPVAYVPTVSVDQYAKQNKIDTAQQTYNSLWAQHTPQSWQTAFQQMLYQSPTTKYLSTAQKLLPSYDVDTALAELTAAWNYVDNYWQESKPLTSAVQPLYTQIQAIRNKYGIF